MWQISTRNFALLMFNNFKINNILVIDLYILNLPLDIAGWSSGSSLGS
jgi:hypothetical protein